MSVSLSEGNPHHPRGFRARRGLNWGLIGLLYASYYMCRYNFRFATPGMVEEFGFSTFQITGMISAWSLAYGTGQLVNGLLTDRIGGKTAMLIGATGTILINLIFGFASFAGTFATFAGIWLLNGYFQSFGAPGMIKMNAAWFRRTERGTFAGIFGFMIQAGWAWGQSFIYHFSVSSGKSSEPRFPGAFHRTSGQSGPKSSLPLSEA